MRRGGARRGEAGLGLGAGAGQGYLRAPSAPDCMVLGRIGGLLVLVS